MISPDAEVSRLRSYLTSLGVSYRDIDTVCDAAASDINEAILTIVSDAMTDAVAYAVDRDIDEFIEDIDVQDYGGMYQIITKSGKTDYSVPERQMLNSLLKNADVAPDGTRYKRIPIGGSTSEKRTMGKNIFDDQRELQSRIADARASLRENLRDNKSSRSNSMTETFRKMVRENMAKRKQFYTAPRDKTSTGTPEIRTVTDKMDPETQWVIPAKDMDMTGYLVDINNRIQQEIYQTVTTIVTEYERLF